MGITHEKFVPVQTRSERKTSFDVADFATVTGREAEWKYTPVAELKELFEAELVTAKPTVEMESVAGITTSYITRSDKRLGSVYAPEDKAAARSYTAAEALLVSITGEENKEAVIRLKNYGTNAAAGLIFIEAAAHSQATVVLVQEGQAKLTETVEIKIGDGANLTLVTIGEWADDAIHISAHHAEIGRDARLKHIAVNMSGKIVRLNPAAHLVNPGGDVEMYGLYFADPGQHLEHQVWINHVAPNCRSRVNYKGALQGRGSHTVWIGDVLIGPAAVGTDSYEQNRNLVLGTGPIADSVPNLEIECGDIEGAGHASATGRFDEEHLFYLMARGIDELTARRLVVHGFLFEIVQQIDNEEIAAQLAARLSAELARSDEAIIAGMGR